MSYYLYEHEPWLLLKYFGCVSISLRFIMFSEVVINNCSMWSRRVRVRDLDSMLHTFTHEALDVEVFVLDPQRLSLAGFPTVLTGDGSSSSRLLFLLLLLQRAVDSLLLKHCRRHTETQRRAFYTVFQFLANVEPISKGKLVWSLWCRFPCVFLTREEQNACRQFNKSEYQRFRCRERQWALSNFIKLRPMISYDSELQNHTSIN